MFKTWVGNHNQDAVGAVSDDLRDDVFKNVDIPLHQIQSAFPLLLSDTSSDHNDPGVSRNRVI